MAGRRSPTRAASAGTTRARGWRQVALVTLVAALAACSSGGTPTSAPSGPLALTSPAWIDGQLIPADYACVGPGKSPPLDWKGVAPRGTAGWGLVAEDLDTTPPFVHWVVSGLGAAVRSTRPNELPPGAVASQASDGAQGWVALCPPSGTVHHYRFTVYALSRSMSLTPAAKPGDAILAFQEAALGRATLTGTLGR